MPKEGQTSATMGPQPRDTERKTSHKTLCDAGLLYSLYTIFNLIFLVCGDLIYIYKELVYAVGFIFCAWNSVLYHAPRAESRAASAVLPYIDLLVAAAKMNVSKPDIYVSLHTPCFPSF